MPEFSTLYLQASDLPDDADTIVTIRSFERKELRQDDRMRASLPFLQGFVTKFTTVIIGEGRRFLIVLSPGDGRAQEVVEQAIPLQSRVSRFGFRHHPWVTTTSVS